jgi:hypothetical protein
MNSDKPSNPRQRSKPASPAGPSRRIAPIQPDQGLLPRIRGANQSLFEASRRQRQEFAQSLQESAQQFREDLAEASLARQDLVSGIAQQTADSLAQTRSMLADFRQSWEAAAQSQRESLRDSAEQIRQWASDFHEQSSQQAETRRAQIEALRERAQGVQASARDLVNGFAERRAEMAAKDSDARAAFIDSLIQWSSDRRAEADLELQDRLDSIQALAQRVRDIQGETQARMEQNRAAFEQAAQDAREARALAIESIRDSVDRIIEEVGARRPASRPSQRTGTPASRGQSQSGPAPKSAPHRFSDTLRRAG